GARERQRLTVEGDCVDAASGALDPVGDFYALTEEGQLDTQTVEPAWHHRVDTQCRGFAAQAQKAPHDEPQRDARTAGVDAPTSIERDPPLRDAPIVRARLVAIGKRGIGARVVAVGLAHSSGGYDG